MLSYTAVQSSSINLFPISQLLYTNDYYFILFRFSGKPCLPAGFKGTFQDVDLETTDPTEAFNTV